MATLEGKVKSRWIWLQISSVTTVIAIGVTWNEEAEYARQRGRNSNAASRSTSLNDRQA